MEKSDLDIEKLKNEIKKLKLEILEKENKIDELLKIINGNFYNTIDERIYIDES